MRRETRELYTIGELSPEARARAIDNHREINFSGGDDCWDAVYEDFLTIAKILGFDIDRRNGISWSGFASQGDGASFRGGYEYAPNWREKLAEHCPTERAVFAIGEELESLKAGVTEAKILASGRHSHEYTMSAECCTADGEESATCDAVAFLDRAARPLARWLYRQLEKENDYLGSDEAVAETLGINEFEFLANGKDA